MNRSLLQRRRLLSRVNKPRRKWTLETFLARVKIIHGTKFDYSAIREEHIDGQKSRVPIKCNQCDYEWTPTIVSHINARNGCPDCGGVAPWTLKRFLDKAQQVHGDKFDYSSLREGHIKGQKSRVPIKCNKCDYEWTPTISNHINMKNGCPDCSGKAPWKLEKFLERARQIHDNKFDYGVVRKEHINGQASRVPVKCNRCDYEWTPTISNHINMKTGCMNCYKNRSN